MTADWRRAFDISVAGRNTALSLNDKRSVVGPGLTDAESMSDSVSLTTVSTVYGVAVPRTLEYYRNAGTWRERIKGIRQREAGPEA